MLNRVRCSQTGIMYINKIIAFPYGQRAGIQTEQIDIVPGGFMCHRNSMSTEFTVVSAFRIKIIGIDSAADSVVIGFQDRNVGSQLTKLECSG